MFNDREKGFKVRRIAMNNTQNERVEVKIVRLLKTSPEFAYQAWTDPEMLRHWFMTTSRSNKTIESDVTEGGHYLIIDQRQGKKIRVEGTYQTLIPGEHLCLTIQMPDFSDQQDDINVYFEERSPGITQMTFFYKSEVPKERRLTQLEYKQKKKEYHDSTVHGFENMFDTMQRYIEEQTLNELEQ